MSSLWFLPHCCTIYLLCLMFLISTTHRRPLHVTSFTPSRLAVGKHTPVPIHPPSYSQHAKRSWQSRQNTPASFQVQPFPYSNCYGNSSRRGRPPLSDQMRNGPTASTRRPIVWTFSTTETSPMRNSCRSYIVPSALRGSTAQSRLSTPDTSTHGFLSKL